MPAGRPTVCTPDMIAAAWEYAKGGWEAVGDRVPSIAGLACEIGVHRETLRLWGNEESNEFFGILKAIGESQERQLVNNGLGGLFAPTITKMMLTKHGYSDKIEQEHTSPDGSMSPPDTVELIAKPIDDQGDD